MKLKVVLFDLDGTLLPMDQKVFMKAYFGGLAKKLAPFGYEANSLISAIWAGSEAMVRNTGDRLNEEVFWAEFAKILGDGIYDRHETLNDFYKYDFDKIKDSCGFDPMAKAAVDAIKSTGLRVALATNPLFPAMATECRIRWAGLEPSDFEIYTTYENSRYCKPNLDYYRSILKELGVEAYECLMVGNDVSEDMIAENLGMRVFLITECILNKDNKDISAYPSGNFADLIKYIESISD